MAFEVVYGNERKVVGKGGGFGVSNAHKESACKAGAGGDGDGIEIGVGDIGLRKGGADNGNDGAEVFAASQLWDDAAIAGVGGDLRGNNGA